MFAQMSPASKRAYRKKLDSMPAMPNPPKPKPRKVPLPKKKDVVKAATPKKARTPKAPTPAPAPMPAMPPGSPMEQDSPMELDNLPTPKPRMRAKAERKMRMMKPKIGTKLKVWNGNADRTPGGLIKSDLMKSPRTGKVISKKQYENGKLRAKNLGLTPK